ncbi:hypothetical protein [Desulfosporosinus sp. SB140]|uniref:hypothetical protein n=1 Tax=Desulfosporosinus paludis TaxID=3115649 RepID=UPI00388EA438
MFDFAGRFDQYDRKARLEPALLTAFPAIVTLVLWFPQLQSLSGGIISFLGAIGIFALLVRISRNAGYKKQSHLIQIWSGMPTTKMLRHRDYTIDKITKARYHKYLQDNISGMSIPTVEQESANPDEADQLYQSAINWLREQTRDKGLFPLVFEENCNYGFSRNLWGLKPWGLIISVVSLVGSGFAISLSHKTNLKIVPFHIWGTIIISLISLLIWLILITPNWVNSSAEAYARALLANCDSECRRV